MRGVEKRGKREENGAVEALARSAVGGAKIEDGPWAGSVAVEAEAIVAASVVEPASVGVDEA